jgi:hypothetical protein
MQRHDDLFPEVPPLGSFGDRGTQGIGGIEGEISSFPPQSPTIPP